MESVFFSTESIVLATAFYGLCSRTSVAHQQNSCWISSLQQFSSRGKLQRFTAQTHQQGLCCLYHIRQKKVGPFQRVILYWFLETLRRWNSCFSWGLDWICYLQAEGWMVALRHQVKGGWGFVGYNLSDVFFFNHYEIMLLFFLSERGEGWRICEWLVMWVVGGCW